MCLWTLSRQSVSKQERGYFYTLGIVPTQVNDNAIRSTTQCFCFGAREKRMMILDTKFIFFTSKIGYFTEALTWLIAGGRRPWPGAWDR